MLRELGKHATEIMDILTYGLDGESNHRKIDNNGPKSGIIPVSVELIGRVSYGAIYSVAHYYEQNGDLMADPDVEFLKITYPDGRSSYYPLTFKQDSLGIYWQHVIFEQENGKAIYRYNRKGQRDLASFCNGWMRNIEEQQTLKKGGK